MRHNIRLVFLSAFVLAALAGCNTISGMGKDIKSAGQAIDDASTTASKKK